LGSLAFVQIASDAVYSQAGTRASLPSLVSPALGERMYRAIAAVAPAPYVNDMLAQAALERNDLHAAQLYAQALPPSVRRDDLLGRIARARGDHAAAQRYFIAADDVFAIGEEVDELAKRDPLAAYRVEQLFINRLEVNATHPDALAEAYWRLGVLASETGRPAPAMTHYKRAVELSPLSSKYLIAAGFQSYDLHDNATAQQYFQRALEVDPGSADAYAGAGMTALRLGDRASAQRYAARSRRYDPHSHALHTLEKLLRQ
jgi:tetratricopeptide (TPR) repeat protein